MGGRLPCLCGPIFATTSVFASISGVTGVGTAPRWAFAAGGAAVLAAAAGAAGESPPRQNASTPTPTTATRMTPRSRGFSPFPGDGVSGTRGGRPFDADFFPINDHSSVFTEFRRVSYSARFYAFIRRGDRGLLLSLMIAMSVLVARPEQQSLEVAHHVEHVLGL